MMKWFSLSKTVVAESAKMNVNAGDEMRQRG